MTLLEFHDNTSRVATQAKVASPMNILKYLLFGTGNSLSIVSDSLIITDIFINDDT